ncbi:MAG TPA: serine protease [Dehalococcoidia bacterium]|nr:serine protease [Dehalococcoidia bacterium]
MLFKSQLIVLFACLAMALLTSCGGGDDDDSEQDADSEATAEPQEVTTGSETADLAEAVVQIYHLREASGGYEEFAWCSGTLIDPGGLILTNAHCTDADQVGDYDALGIGLLQDVDEPTQPAFFAEVVEEDIDEDLAVLQITTDNEGNEVDPRELELPTVTLGDPDAVQLGDDVRVIGYPAIGADPDEFFFSADFGPSDVRITVTQGTISGFGQLEGEDVIQTDALISGGNSGGGAFNDDGQLIGVPTFGLAQDESGQSLNGIRPVSLALDLIENARESGGPRGEFICATCDEDESGEEVEAPEEEILEVDPGTFSPQFSNVVVSSGADANNLPIDTLDVIPVGLNAFFNHVDFSGLVDGVTWTWYCLHEGGSDFAVPEYQTWAYGTGGHFWFTCFTEDGSALPAGNYDVFVTFLPPGGEETTYIEYSVTVQ